MFASPRRSSKSSKRTKGRDKFPTHSSEAEAPVYSIIKRWRRMSEALNRLQLCSGKTRGQKSPPVNGQKTLRASFEKEIAGGRIEQRKLLSTPH